MTKRTDEFIDAVSRLSKWVGRSAPRITDELIKDLFPQTRKAASKEGGMAMFRDGVCKAVREALKTTIEDLEDGKQRDFSEIHPEFYQFTQQLKAKAYYVEALGLFVSVEELIDTPEWLDDARKYLRRKGEETIREAYALDALYEQVMKKRRRH